MRTSVTLTEWAVSTSSWTSWRVSSSDRTCRTCSPTLRRRTLRVSGVVLGRAIIFKYPSSSFYHLGQHPLHRPQVSRGSARPDPPLDESADLLGLGGARDIVDMQGAVTHGDLLGALAPRLHVRE